MRDIRVGDKAVVLVMTISEAKSLQKRLAKKTGVLAMPTKPLIKAKEKLDAAIGDI